MLYGYARCSTNELKQDITRQTKELKQYGVHPDNIYFEYESGTKTNRAELNKLLSIVKQGDTIVTTEVSRITRSTKQLCDLIDFVKENHIKLVIGNSMTVDCTAGDIDPMTKAFIQIAGVFAELERNMTVSRIVSGMQNAKSKGKHIGRREVTKEDIPQVFIRYYNQYSDKEINVTELAKLCGMSRTTVYKYIRLIEG
jgi:DNA invertase Pin-like site-specific DNA recombinase